MAMWMNLEVTMTKVKQLTGNPDTFTVRSGRALTVTFINYVIVSKPLEAPNDLSLECCLYTQKYRTWNIIVKLRPFHASLDFLFDWVPCPTRSTNGKQPWISPTGHKSTCVVNKVLPCKTAWVTKRVKFLLSAYKIRCLSRLLDMAVMEGVRLAEVSPGHAL